MLRLFQGLLVRQRVVGVSAGNFHTEVWTNERDAYFFGNGSCCRLVHGGEGYERVPRLIEGLLVGKRVVGVAAGDCHTVVMTDEGKVYSSRLGHGG